MNEDLQDSVSKAMKAAFQWGQIYWRQADSIYASENLKADTTKKAFDALVEKIRAEVGATPNEAVEKPGFQRKQAS